MFCEALAKERGGWWVSTCYGVCGQRDAAPFPRSSPAAVFPPPSPSFNGPLLFSPVYFNSPSFQDTWPSDPKYSAHPSLALQPLLPSLQANSFMFTSSTLPSSFSHKFHPSLPFPYPIPLHDLLPSNSFVDQQYELTQYIFRVIPRWCLKSYQRFPVLALPFLTA
jgi:hypothetical protein